ncbi:MAG: Pr6Pr family membrane protein [Parvularculaceae bacterium]
MAGTACLAALIVQFILLLELLNGDVGAAALRFLTYFTLLSNAAGAAAFLFPALAPKTSAGTFLARPSVRTATTATTLYLLVVEGAYHTILASRWDPQGWQLAVDIALHTISPLAMLFDWLFLTPKRGLKLALLPSALVFPAAFGVFALLQGAVTGFYPYPFVDVTALGLARVILNLFLLLMLFALLGALMTIAGRRFAR